MFTVNVSCLVDRPLDKVFEYVADFRNAPTWQPQLDSVRLDGGPFPQGKQVVEIHHFVGVRVQAVGNLVDWQPMDSFTIRGGSGPLRVESMYSFVRESGGTRVQLSVTVNARGPARMMEPVLRRQLTDNLTESFLRLGRTLEATLSR